MNRAARRQQKRTAMRRRTSAVVVSACLAASLLGACSHGESSQPLTKKEFCAELRKIDPGPSFAGDNSTAVAKAAVRIKATAPRSPKAARSAMKAIAAEVDKHPDLVKLPKLKQGDKDYGQAFQAAYALRFNQRVAVAAALLERYGVDECAMAPSGLFDIEAVRDSDLTAAALPVLTQEDLEELRVEFEPSDLEGYELKPFEIPDVEFKQDLEEFQLKDNEKSIPPASLGE
jgi:hypothetical protein